MPPDSAESRMYALMTADFQRLYAGLDQVKAQQVEGIRQIGQLMGQYTEIDRKLTRCDHAADQVQEMQQRLQRIEESRNAMRKWWLFLAAILTPLIVASSYNGIVEFIKWYARQL
jgi:uncharacterized membrane protein YjjP (DUF1212 family)